MKIITELNIKEFLNLNFQKGIFVFTTFILYENKYLFLEEHIERVLKGADYLFPSFNWKSKSKEIKDYLEFKYIKYINDQINNLTLKNPFAVKVIIFDDFIYFTTRPVTQLDQNIKAKFSRFNTTSSLKPSFLKTPNYLVAHLELNEAISNGYNEVLFFNENNLLTEATTSNAFVVLDENLIITPPVSSLVLDGVMRNKLIINLLKLNYLIKEREISKEELKNAKEVWLTNSVRGITALHQIENANLKKSLHSEIVNKIGTHCEKIL